MYFVAKRKLVLDDYCMIAPTFRPSSADPTPRLRRYVLL